MGAQTVLVVGWALVGAAGAATLRPAVARHMVAAEPTGAPLPSGVLEAINAVLFAALAYRFSVSMDLLVFSALTAACVPLAALDLLIRRLPNALIASAYVSVLGLLAIDAILKSDFADLVRAVVCLLGAVAVHGLLYAAGGIAGGDLKLAGVLGAALGATSWQAGWLGFALGWLLGGITVASLGAIGKRSALHPIPLGPFLIAGTSTTLLILGP